MGQRITNGMMINAFNRNLNDNTLRMSRQQEKLATGRKTVRLSDDPVSVVKVINAKAKLSDIEQYQKNLRDAEEWLIQTESALTELNEIIKRVYELAVNAANDVLDVSQRTAISDEVSQLKEQVLTLANSTMGDKYIFGGYNTTYGPFTADYDTGEVYINGENMIDTDGDMEFIHYNIGFDLGFDVSISGSEFMGVGEEDNVYYQMFRFAEDLKDPEASNETLSPYIASMKKLQDNTLTTLADVGSRVSRIEFMNDRYAKDFINYTQMRSDSDDVDQAEEIMNFTMAEAVYRAALNVGGRILQPSLLDFMR